jgi:hypothetical protein
MKALELNRTEEFAVIQPNFKTDSKGRKVQFMVILWNDEKVKGVKSYYVAIQKCVNGKEFGVCQKGKEFKSELLSSEYGYRVAKERLDLL